MLAEFATFSLVLALLASLLAGSALFSARLRPVIAPASAVAALLIFFAFVILIVLRIDSDFSVANVAEHSNRALPLSYKIAGAWGNHEGSMLLWMLVLSGCGAMLAAHHATAAAVQAWLSTGIMVFILMTSNPFARLFPPAIDGKMLNPLLQDMALAIHPPLLYLGYVGFSAVFSLAVAGLLARRIDGDWAKRAHPWIMGAWGFLTAGIALGSWWAYRELGWGGFWFWDPVENASLLPWLCGTALFHSNIVLKKRGALAGWVVLLAILTFALSLIGTFLVRSAAITSVHSFASDPTRGLFILGYIVVVIGGALWLYGARMGSMPPGATLRPASREGVIVINNLFLLTACSTVLLGTLYPLLAEAIGGDRITVGAPYFNRTFLPLMAVPLFFAGLSAYLPWKKAAISEAISRAWPAWCAAFAAVALVLFTMAAQLALACIGLGLAAFLMAASTQWLASGRWKNRSFLPVWLGHTGAALLVLGITCTGLWSSEVEGFASTGDHLSLAGYTINYRGEEAITTPNYTALRAILELHQKEKRVATLLPEYRHYAMRGTTTSEAAIYSAMAYDIYAVIGEKNEAGKTAIRLYFRPGISWLWLGASMIAVSGVIAVLNRRRA